MRRILKALVRIIFIAVPLVLIATGAGFVWMSRSLPPGSGRMQIDQLTDIVTISRDGNGVPHISGASIEDVFTGLGFAHAQDRMWQMEVVRIAAQGRLSELFGAQTVNSDKWLRSMAIIEAAQSSYDMLPEASQRAIRAYSNGVNAWLNREGREFASRLPPEFVILGHEPAAWDPAHTVAALKMMSVTLASNSGSEVQRLSFARLGLTADEISDLLPALTVDNPPPLPDLTALLGLDTGPLSGAKSTAAAQSDFIPMGQYEKMGASNNWVLSGARTKSGQPILANDPHLSLSAPSVWYLAHLKIDGPDREQNLVGATTPGSPLVLLGRSNELAWGLTNTASDVQDIFVERTNPDNEDEYLTPDGWQPFGKKQETIKIRGGEAVSFTRRWTRHGPVLPMAYMNIGQYLPDNTVAVLQWVALAGDDLTFDSALSSVNETSVEGFQNAMANYVTPMQSIVVADTAGNIGLIAPGRVPVRDPNNLVMGRAPVPGWDSDYDWKGTIPFEGLPRQFNPEKGAIGTANTKIVGPDYPYLLTFDWDEPWRQDRINALIVDNRAPQTTTLSQMAQADVTSTAFASIGPRMIALVEAEGSVEPQALRTLKTWDYTMAREGRAPLIFMAWIRESMKGIYADDLGAAFDPWFRARVDVIQKLLDGQVSRDWCDDRLTVGQESCADILAAALTRAISNLEARYGEDRSQWSWGKAHLSAGAHAPFSKVPMLKWFFDIQVESAGGPFTLDRGLTTFSDAESPFINTHGSSFRGIYDFSDLDRSTFIQTTGQSGNPFSRHYRDFARPWSDVEAIRIPTDPAVYEMSVKGTWQLAP